jgi:hypothetical protein
MVDMSGGAGRRATITDGAQSGHADGPRVVGQSTHSGAFCWPVFEARLASRYRQALCPPQWLR